jgi:hypothetical protein
MTGRKNVNKSRFIGGILCLALAALLGALNLALPADKVMFTVGNENMPWVPVAILAIVGILLLSTAMSDKQQTDTQVARPEVAPDSEKVDLNKRLGTIGWGCFLIMLGGFMLVPNSVVAKGFWSIGVGIIMLGLNVARYLNDIKMSGFTTFLGVISVLSGILQLAGLEAIEGASLLIVLGAFLLLKPWLDRQYFSAMPKTPERPRPDTHIVKEGR